MQVATAPILSPNLYAGVHPGHYVGNMIAPDGKEVMIFRNRIRTTTFWLEDYDFGCGSSEVDGVVNTRTLVERHGMNAPAAWFCATHRDTEFPDINDWYLPAADELVKIVKLNPKLFANMQLWTSTEKTANMAWSVGGNTCRLYSSNKDDMYDVIAFRRVPVQK